MALLVTLVACGILGCVILMVLSYLFVVYFRKHVKSPTTDAKECKGLLVDDETDDEKATSYGGAYDDDTYHFLDTTVDRSGHVDETLLSLALKHDDGGVLTVSKETPVMFTEPGVCVVEKKPENTSVTLEDVGIIVDKSPTSVKSLDVQLITLAGVGSTIPNVESPMPNVESPIPNVECPIPNVESPTPNVESSLPNVESPIPNVQSPITEEEYPMLHMESTIPVEVSPTHEVGCPILESELPTPEPESTCLESEPLIIEARSAGLEYEPPAIEVKFAAFEYEHPILEAGSAGLECEPPILETKSAGFESEPTIGKTVSPIPEPAFLLPAEEHPDTTSPFSSDVDISTVTSQNVDIIEENRPKHRQRQLTSTFTENAILKLSLQHIKSLKCLRGKIKSIEGLDHRAVNCPDEINFHLRLLPSKRFHVVTRSKQLWEDTGLALSFTIGPLSFEDATNSHLRIKLYGKKANRLSRSRCYGECSCSLDEVIGKADAVEFEENILQRTTRSITYSSDSDNLN